MSEEKPQNETAPEPTVRVYNKGTRVFIHGKHRAEKGAFVTLPKSVADRWLEMFPNEVLSAADATAQIGGANAALAEAQKRIAALEKLLEEKTDPKKTRDKDLV